MPTRLLSYSAGFVPIPHAPLPRLQERMAATSFGQRQMRFVGKVLSEWRRVHDQDKEVRRRVKMLMQAMNKLVFDGWNIVLQVRPCVVLAHQNSTVKITSLRINPHNDDDPLFCGVWAGEDLVESPITRDCRR